MKKSIVIFAVLAAVVAAFTACEFGKKDVSYGENDLFGYWQENNKQAFVRFTNDKNVSGEYTDYKYYGYEWNEAEDVQESDVLEDKYGNGWFMWTLVQSDLKELILMGNDGAKIPKKYVVLKLTDTELEYKDEFGVQHSFFKVVSTK